MGNTRSFLIDSILCCGFGAFYEWTKWITSYFFVMFRKKRVRKYEYNMKVHGDPFKIGFFIPPQEWDIECFSQSQEIDEVFCFGVNSSGGCLALQISRDCVCDYSSSLFLKVNGYTYSLPAKFHFVRTDQKNAFGDNRFYMQCLSPFRKWKIFFNGMLREISEEKEHDRIVHVRLSFIWVASSGVFDFTSDYSTSSMADILCETKWNTWTPPIDRILCALNEYHQPGMLHGSVQIEEEAEQRIILWGSRRHSFGVNEDEWESQRIDIFGNTENGILFCFKILSIDRFVKRILSGFIMLPNGSLKVARFKSVKRIKRYKKIVLSFQVKAGGQFYNVSSFFYGYGDILGKGGHEHLFVSAIDVIVNGVWGSGIAVERTYSKGCTHNVKCKLIRNYMRRPAVAGLLPLVVTFEDPHCLNKSLTGNLGSSLAKLIRMKDEISLFDMPEGLVITTSGYEEFSLSIRQAMWLLRENIPKYTSDELMPLCDRTVNEVSNSFFPSEIYDSLCRKLNEIIDSSESTVFCVYPSIDGTDSAVQLLEAYLEYFANVTGLPEIIRCIKKCWASQFSYGAIVCKRSTGQALNMQMGVIVQKVIPYKITGIISTCDPSSGNPAIMEIREESAEPCTGTIRVTKLKRDLRNQIKVLDTITLDDCIKSNKECHVNRKNKSAESSDEKCQLSKDQVIYLGRIAFKVEKEFQYPLCIEWCLKKNKFFIVQIRPIISMNAESKLEIIHYYDSYLRTEDDWYTAFNTGEAFVGALSPLGMDIFNGCMEMILNSVEFLTPQLVPFTSVPYFPKFLLYSCCHLLHSLVDGMLCFQILSEGIFLKMLPLVMNCKAGEEQILQDLIFHRHRKFSLSYRAIFQCLSVLLSSGNRCKLFEKQISAFVVSLNDTDSAINSFYLVSCHYQDISEPFLCYLSCKFTATVWSMVVMYILVRIRQNKYELNKVYTDFNFLMCAYSNSQEGDIPLDILALSHRIARAIDPNIFKTLPVEDAQIWLEDSEVDKKIHFSEFMAKHGHRCFKEVDIFTKCWSMDPSTVIKVLQVIVPSVPLDFVPNPPSLDQMISQLPKAPNYFQKLLLKYAVPKCVNSLRDVRRAKSNLLKVASFWRQAFHHVADMAVKEFCIPFPEILFFLTLDDIRQVLRVKSPDLVMKALKCWEMHSTIDKYIFPVITIGIPEPLSENFYDDKRLKINYELKGCPVGRGTVVGTAVVAIKPDDVEHMEKGAILITRNPSIVWSLYFPILGGFAADLGGLLSDGAVSARDYGLPCVINLIRASQILKTGDRVFLDGNTGVLRRISNG